MRLAGQILRRTERDLVRAMKTGDIFGPADLTDPASMPSIRATVIRDLLGSAHTDFMPDPKGLRLRNVRIVGRIDLDNLETRVPLDLELCDLAEGLTAVRSRISTLRIRRMSIRRHSSDEAVLNLEDLHAEGLDLTGTTLINEQGPALYADELTVESNLVLDGLTVHGAGPEAALRLIGATVHGQLSAKDAHINNHNGPGLAADRITVDSTVFLNEGFTAQGHGTRGALRLINATVHGELQLAGAHLTNHAGTALHARGLTVHDNALLDRGFLAEGEGNSGTVRLINATVHGQLQLAGARLTNHEGPALKARGLIVDADVYLDRGFTAVGVDPQGAVRLPGATIQGRLKIAEAHIINYAGPAVHAERLSAHLGTHLDFDHRAQDPPWSPSEARTENRSPPCTGSSTVVLTAADLGATLQISPRTLKAAHFAGRWTITGLTYRSLEKETLEHWLDFLQHGTQDYSPQPYQQFAAVARAHGDERLTRNILITQRDDQRIRGQVNHWQKAGLHVLQATVGYGYQSWKALVWLGGLLIMAGIMIHGLGTEELNGLHRPANPQVGVSEGLCTGIDLLTLTIQILPLLPLPPAATNACVPDTTPGGYAYLLLSTLMKIGAWALVTLFATGYTNIVRRPHT